MNPCPYCNQPFGEITDNSSKLITFENRTYQLNVHGFRAFYKLGEYEE